MNRLANKIGGCMREDKDIEMRSIYIHLHVCHFYVHKCVNILFIIINIITIIT